MNSTLTLQYPIWFTALCLVLGLVYALVLYLRDRSFKDASKTQKRFLPFMALLRFLGVSSIALLLLGPLLKKKFEQVQKPYIVIAQDNTESVKNAFLEGDSSKLSQQIQQLIDEFGDEVEIKQFLFEDKIIDKTVPDYTGKVTNISSTLEDIHNRFSYQNVGAIILATDGIYNEGSNPAYSSIKMDVPVYTVALGDTTPARDIKIDKVLHNSIAYKDDKFTIRADVSAFNAKGSRTVLNVYGGKGTSNKLYSKPINIDKERFFVSEEVILDAKAKGVQQYTISVSQIEDELSTANNIQKIYVEVLEGKQKILLLANSAHPDLTALKQAIEHNKNYEATVKYIDKFDGNINEVNLVIFHGLPAVNKSITALYDKLKQKSIPSWFIVSGQTNVNDLSKIQSIVKVSGASGAVNDVQSLVSGAFNLFTFDKSYSELIEDFPPLKSPYGDYSVSPTAQTFFNQKIGNIDTDYPLFAMEQANNYKTAVLTGEGIWRWRMFDYLKNKNFDAFNEIISKSVQYLAVKNDKRQFKINIPKNIYNENENISFDAELYNDSYELINEPEANIRVVNDEGKEYNFNFTKTANAYTLDAGKLPIGDYQFSGKTTYNGKELKSAGSFTIRELKLETVQTTADHNMLKLLAENYNGEMIKSNNIAGLAQKILKRDEVTPVLYHTYKSEPVINLKWLFFIILSFLALEWFLRKYNGGY